MSEIKHQWNGTILTVISDSGASSADLKGPKGDTGPRGPQGPGGVIYNEEGEVVVDLSEYYTKTEVDDKVANVEVDLSGYATKVDVIETVANEMVKGDYATKSYVESQDFASKDYVHTKVYNEIQAGDLASESFVTTQIAKAQLSQVAGDVDLSGFATKDDLDNIEVKVDGTSIISKNGIISTSLGGGYMKDAGDGYIYFGSALNVPVSAFGYQALDTPLAVGQTYNYRVVTERHTKQGTGVLDDDKLMDIFDIDIDDVQLYLMYSSTRQEFTLSGSADSKLGNLFEFALWTGTEPNSAVPINGRFIPVDGVTITLNEKGQLTVIGGGEGLASSEEVYY